MDIPYVAISWNDKLLRFSENVGRIDAIIGKENLEAQYIVDMLEKYQSEDYESEKKKAFMLTTYNCFKKYLI